MLNLSNFSSILVQKIKCTFLKMEIDKTTD